MWCWQAYACRPAGGFTPSALGSGRPPPAPALRAASWLTIGLRSKLLRG